MINTATSHCCIIYTNKCIIKIDCFVKKKKKIQDCKYVYIYLGNKIDHIIVYRHSWILHSWILHSWLQNFNFLTSEKAVECLHLKYIFSSLPLHIPPNTLLVLGGIRRRRLRPNAGDHPCLS